MFNRPGVNKKNLDLDKQEPGWTWYEGHPIDFTFNLDKIIIPV